MELWDCKGGTIQKYAIRGLIQDWAAMRLDVAGVTFANGQPIITWPCNSGGAAQKWYFSP